LKEINLPIIIDESTDESVHNLIAIMVQYWDFNANKLQMELMDLVEVEEASANGLYKTVIQLLQSLGIPLNR
jgi:hypothetical protein